MDRILLPLLNAQDEQQRQQCLDELLTIHVAPIVRKVLRKHLGFYVSAQGLNASNHEAEDLYQEAMTRVVQVLREDQRLLAAIENFGGYVSRIVSNICFDFRRAKFPARARLKNSLRDVFRRHRNLASWQHENEILCGFAVWRNIGKRVLVESMMEAFLSARFADEDVKVVPLVRVVEELFDLIGGPVEIDDLVGILVQVLGIKDRQIESLDDPLAAELDTHSLPGLRSTELHLETNDLLERLWSVLKQLPAQQRDAFVFRFESQDGENLFTVLLAAGIVNWKDLASGMERSVEQILRLRTQMPMDTERAARELNTSRQNVNKWRFRALEKLRNEFS